MSDKEIKIGDSITLTDDSDIELIKLLDSRVKDSHMSFRLASNFARTANDDLWDAVFNLYPHLKGYKLTYVAKSDKIIVTGKEYKD